MKYVYVILDHQHDPDQLACDMVYTSFEAAEEVAKTLKKAARCFDANIEVRRVQLV